MDSQLGSVRLSMLSAFQTQNASAKVRERLVLQVGATIFAPAVLILCLSSNAPRTTEPVPSATDKAKIENNTTGRNQEVVLTSFTVPDEICSLQHPGFIGVRSGEVFDLKCLCQFLQRDDKLPDLKC